MHSSRLSQAHHYALAFTLLLAPMLVAYPAFAAATLECVGGTPVAGTHLYPAAALCPTVTFNQIFSGLVCNYELVLDEILRRVYCAVQAGMINIVAAVVLIYVIVFGISFMFGIVQFNAKEIVSRSIRIALIVMFAMYSTWGIGIAFNFFEGAANTVTQWVFAVFLPAPGTWQYMSIFSYLDAIVIAQITGPFTSGGAKLIGLVSVLSYIIPPLFLLFVYFFLKSIMIFLRALISYLLAISAIAFLFAMMPIFLSFALFQVTYHFFDSWLKYIISFTLQIILIFTALALWLFCMSYLGTFFVQLSNIIVNYDKVWWVGANRDPIGSFGLCSYTYMWVPNVGYQMTCIPGGRVMPASELIFQGPFLYFVMINLISLTIVTYAFDTLFRNIPDLARQLSGPKYAPQVGGGYGPGAIQFPGFGSARQMGLRGAHSFMGKEGGLPEKMGAGMEGILEQIFKLPGGRNPPGT